ncbi:MAG: NAD-dependent epimerase/dehydratase family protein [Actinomycetia bacterium]|nr:NAD-dependent epimerase/dehydratase family protein [Actinomycetes bacterium]MCP4961554.1 NAD-dependent epimerase/dehydratase family protein [Actinomycetes bacterium]
MSNSKFLVTGAAGELGALVISALRRADPDCRIVATDVDPLGARGPVGLHDEAVDFVSLDVARDVELLTEMASSSDVIVHLAWSDSSSDAEIRAGEDLNREMCLNVLRAAELGGVAHLVMVSSATVYGAWPNSPVPISEIEPLRPNPGFRYAETKAEHERLIVEWRRRTGIGVSILRPAPAVADRHVSWLGDAVMNAAAMKAGLEDPPTQFLHQNDLASAIALAAVRRLDGPYNVAPDGWLTGEELRALFGPRPRVRLPTAMAERVEAWLVRSRRSPRPAGLLPYTMNSWVVANDRLRRAGWKPESENDEAFIEADQAPPWVALNAKQRQYLSLGALAAVLTCAVIAVTVVVFRRHGRPRTLPAAIPLDQIS